MIEQRLLKLKEKIETAKAEKARAEGALQQLRQRLVDEFDVVDEYAAEQLLDSLRKQSAELTQQVAAAVQDMEAKYGL